MKAVILSGGLGTRLLEETVIKPKPMVEIGGMPILWHIMSSYANHGFKEFVVALGYKGDWIKSYFLNRYNLRGDITINLGNGSVQLQDQVREDWLIHLVDSGLDTSTGGRLMRLKGILSDGTFLMTYGDGVCDVNIKRLVEFHRSHGKCATVTAVRPPARFGVLTIDERSSSVKHFGEKPQLSEGWINGGFFVFEPRIFNYLTDEHQFLEQGPLQRLAAEGELCAFLHDGFWQCMDTLRDVRYLEELWSTGKAPWKTWSK